MFDHWLDAVVVAALILLAAWLIFELRPSAVIGSSRLICALILGTWVYLDLVAWPAYQPRRPDAG